MSKIGQNLHSFEKIFSSPLDRQRDGQKVDFEGLKNLSPQVVAIETPEKTTP